MAMAQTKNDSQEAHRLVCCWHRFRDEVAVITPPRVVATARGGNRLGVLMGKFEDLSGRVFGRWTVIRQVANRGRGSRWFCRCSCGTEKETPATGLRSGLSQSCGCLHREIKRTHGRSKSSLYRRWHGIVQRCTNPNHIYFENYGGRGITMCKRWRESFAAFAEDMGEPPAGHTIDRINNDGNYEPGNCRWATPGQQENNKRNNVRVTHDGESRTLSEWSRVLGISTSTLHYRKYAGWPDEEILFGRGGKKK